MNVTTVLSFLLSIVFIIAGLLLMGYAFEAPGFELILFAAGAIAEFIGIAIPAVLWRLEDRKVHQ
ncbi:hypothetical protein [Agrococcus sp. ARC_14]|uniref:hypothetical protein n=1 Tax=Agrococcus sp. ARC_14 TaxID=2919927 RepID=UPI001F06C650|nr:hypothetical protein [Agrococcus sp. ARC_14]MCH1883054.1 hypothetical protein [Agrococcus sp. ARC_14]